MTDSGAEIRPPELVLVDVGNPETPARVHRWAETGYVHSWELVTSVDGPGTRLSVFLSGCALHCQYCHNPDTWRLRSGKRCTAEQLMGRIRRYAAIFKATGGGVTLTGGEPLLQAAFVDRIFGECRQLGIHTALDTSGYLEQRASDALLKNTDLVLLDVKSGDPEIYRRVTGGALAPTLKFGRRLSALGVRIWIRYVLVPGLTDGWDNVALVADYAASLDTVDRVEVLPFHQMGRDKWSAIGRDYPLKDTLPPDAALIDRVRQQFGERQLLVY